MLQPAALNTVVMGAGTADLIGSGKPSTISTVIISCTGRPGPCQTPKGNWHDR
jgi:hypothetical protein